MRLEIPRETERLGAVLVHSVQKVYELDSGMGGQIDRRNDRSVIQRIPYEQKYVAEKDMAIVIPMRGERIKLVEGVLSGIPNHCLIIILSNSPRAPVDRFAIERDAFRRFSRFTDKQVIVAHQKDPILAQACVEAGYPYLLDEQTGAVRNGKAEGMILATLLARLAGKRYIGFIDADNYFPGAVLEYVREYGVGLSMSRSKHKMVRISWHSKPKVTETGLYFAKWGRASRQTNRYLNALISEYTGFETEIITTGNAGEHAMTMDLAMMLDYSAGYSIEPYHYVNLFERFGGLTSNTLPQELVEEHIEIFQIESRNPHMHDVGKGDVHINDMAFAAMQVIYHSPICPRKLKAALLRDMERMEMVGKDEEPALPLYYPSLANIDLDAFRATVEGQVSLTPLWA